MDFHREPAFLCHIHMSALPQRQERSYPLLLGLLNKNPAR